MRSLSRFTRTLCLPSAMWGPFCSVPPIGTRIVVFPDLMTSRSSVQVSSSSWTVSGAWANAAAAVPRTSSTDTIDALARRMLPDDSPDPRLTPTFESKDVQEEPAEQLRLEPGALGRHDLPGVGHRHQLAHRGRPERD